MGQMLMSTFLADLLNLLSARRELWMGTPPRWASPRMVAGFQEGASKNVCPKNQAEVPEPLLPHSISQTSLRFQETRLRVHVRVRQTRSHCGRALT